MKTKQNLDKQSSPLVKYIIRVFKYKIGVYVKYFKKFKKTLLYAMDYFVFYAKNTLQ